MPRPLRQNIVSTDSATVAANGTATVKIRPRSSAYNWAVTQLSLEMPDAPAGAIVELRRNGAFIDAPFSARKASAGGDPPIPLRSGDELTVEWSGATPNTIGRVTYIYDESPI